MGAKKFDRAEKLVFSTRGHLGMDFLDTEIYILQNQPVNRRACSSRGTSKKGALRCSDEDTCQAGYMQ